MPGYFRLGLYPALEEFQARLHHGDRVVAFFDDIFIIIVPERTQANHDIVEEVAPWRTDFFFCELTFPSTERKLARGASA